MAEQQMQKEESSDMLQVQFGTRATLNNKTPNVMKLDRSINWSGSPSIGFPATIANYGTAVFVHNRDGQLGSIGAVQYNGPKAPGGQGDATAYILAWHAPADNTKPKPPNRVYITCRTKYRMDNISWDQVLFNLEQGSTKYNDQHPYSKTIVDAIIDDSTPGYATLISSFGFTK